MKVLTSAIARCTVLLASMACRKPTCAKQHAIDEIVIRGPGLYLALDARRRHLTAPICTERTADGAARVAKSLSVSGFPSISAAVLPIAMGVSIWKGARDLKVWGEKWSIV